jgi:hypothetical protein
MALIPTTQVNVSPDDYKRRIAFALMQQGADTSPVQAWTQGAARALQGALGGYEMYQDDQKQKSDDASTSKAYLDFLNPGAGSSPQASATPGSEAPTTGAPSPVATALSEPYKIYSNNAPSPLDPPSGQDRLNMIKTILGEENTPAGQAGVANVIRNRAVDGSYGGDTPSAVVQAPNQFEPWNTQAGRSRMVAALQDPKQVAQADAAIKGAYGEGGQGPNDPTEGKTMFFSPQAQAALGRPPPTWAQGPGQMLGKTAFYDDNSEIPPNAQPTQGTSPYQVAGPPTAGPQASPVAQALAPQAAPQAAPATPDDTAKAQIAAMLQSQNPQARKMGQTLASAYITSKMTADNTPISVGGKLVTKTGKVIYDGTEDPNSVKEFEYGQTHPGFTAYQQSAKTPLVNIDNKAEGAFKTKAAQLQAERYNDLATEAPAAKQMISDVQTLTELGKNIQTGKLAEAKAAIGPYAQALGVDVKGLNETQAFEAIVNRVAPSLRVKGSGAQSDFELKNFLKSLPSLGNTEEGNAIASKTMQGLYQNKLAASEIGSKALNGEITPSEADKQIRDLPDHMADYRDYLKAHPAGKTAPDISALKQKYGLQ